MEQEERNKRIYDLVKNKMGYMFKEVLTAIEKETKDFDIKSDFFAKSKGKPTGFFMIRKRLFDKGNEIIELLGIILDKVELTPKDSIVRLSKEAMKEINEKEKK